MEYFACVPTEGSNQYAISVHHDKSELLVTLQQCGEWFDVESTITQIQGCIYRSEGLEVDGDLMNTRLAHIHPFTHSFIHSCELYLLFLVIVGEDRSAVDHEPIVGDSVVELESLLCGRDRFEHRETIHTGLDVGSSSIFVSQHLRSLGNLTLGREDQGNHAGSVPVVCCCCC